MNWGWGGGVNELVTTTRQFVLNIFTKNFYRLYGMLLFLMALFIAYIYIYIEMNELFRKRHNKKAYIFAILFTGHNFLLAKSDE